MEHVQGKRQVTREELAAMAAGEEGRAWLRRSENCGQEPMSEEDGQRAVAREYQRRSAGRPRR